MLKALGIKDYLELTLLAAIIALVAISALGHEGTAPIIFIGYRLLLAAITLGSIAVMWRRRDPEPNVIFVALCGLALFLMLVSILWNPGSRFDGFYRWYQHLLFGAAFLAMAALHRHQSTNWKRAVLWSVILIDLIYLAAAVHAGRSPLLGPFVNPNYFASFLLVGFAGAAAIVLFENRPMERIAAACFAILLYYGMTQAWSRGATLAAIGVTALGIVRYSRGRGISHKKIALIVGLALVAGAAASPVLVRKFLDRGQVDPYNYQRPQIWLSTLRIIVRHPVLGVGLAEFDHISSQFSPAVEGTIARYMKRPGIAHSEYLQYAAESGIPAAVLLFALAGYLLYIAAQRAQSCSTEQRVFQEAAILTAVGLGTHALVDNNWGVPIMAAGLVVFSLADSLPLEPQDFTIKSSPRLKVVLAMGLVFLLCDSIILPGLALYFNESGHQAFDRGDLAKAESMHRLAAAIAPEHDVFLDNAGSVYFDMYMKSGDKRRLDFAETFFEKAMLANPNSETPGLHLEAALIQRLTGDARRDHPIHVAIAAVDRDILTIDPFNPFVRRNLAEALYNSGSRQEAERELNRAIEFEPNYVPGYLRIAEWYKDGGDLAASNSYRQKAVAVMQRYANLKTSEPYEARLLGRPEEPLRKP